MSNGFHRAGKILGFLPAIVALVTFVALVGRGIYRSEQITSDYRAAARKAIAEEDLTKAKFFYSRLIGDDDQGSAEDQFNMVSVLEASGDEQAASDLLDQLAPDDEIGYPRAHLRKAMMLQQSVATNGPQTDLIKRFKWHLQHGASTDSLETDLLWLNYHLALQEMEPAAMRLISAANRNPDYWFDVALLYRRMNRSDDAAKALNRAEGRARSMLENEPQNTAQRLRLAEILMQKKDTVGVQEVLRDGLRLSASDANLRRAASNFTLSRLSDIGTEQDANSQRSRFLLLDEAVRLDPNNASVYQAMASIHSQLTSDEQRKAYRKHLQGWVAEGVSVAYAHFVLGNFLWLEGESDDSIFHLERAMELDNSLLIVANNLAYMLTHREEPELDRAEKLVRLAIEAQPQQVNFIDTLADVLFAQEKWDEALNAYERVLPQSRGQKRRTIHQQLAKIYDKLDKPELAQSHREQLAGLTDK